MSEQLPLFGHEARFKAKQRMTSPGAAGARASAAADIVPHAETTRAQVLDYLRRRGRRGATDQETAEALGMGDNTERARRNELVDLGLVVDSGRRGITRSGRSAVLWILAELAGERGSAPRRATGAPAIPREMTARQATAAGPGAQAPPRRSAATAPAEAFERSATKPDTPAGLVCERRRFGRCPWCGSGRLWRSVYGVVVCGDCHPPASAELVAEWNG